MQSVSKAFSCLASFLLILAPTYYAFESSSPSNNLNILPLSRSGRSRSQLSERATGTQALIDPFSIDYLYTIPALIGTPSQNISLLVSSGSSLSWVYQAGTVATYHTSFNVTTSTTFRNASTAWTTGSGGFYYATMSGYLANDTMTVGGLTFLQQGIGIANAGGPTSDGIGTPELNGVFGLAFSALAGPYTGTFFENLKNAGQLDNPYFSFYLQRDQTLTLESQSGSRSSWSGADGPGGEMCIGCQDTSKYNGTMEYYDVTASSPTWTIEMSNIEISGNVAYSNSIRMRVEPGFPTIILPSLVVENLMSTLLPGGTLVSSVTTMFLYMNYLQLDCSFLETLSFGLTFGSTTYYVNHTDLIYYTIGNGSCLTPIVSGDMTDADGVTPLGILGDAFLRNVYSTFAYGNAGAHQVGFAPYPDTLFSTNTSSGSSSSAPASSSTGASTSPSVSNSSKSSDAGAIAGGVVGGLAALGIALAAFWWWTKKHKRGGNYTSAVHVVNFEGEKAVTPPSNNPSPPRDSYPPTLSVDSYMGPGFPNQPPHPAQYLPELQSERRQMVSPVYGSSDSRNTQRITSLNNSEPDSYPSFAGR